MTVLWPFFPNRSCYFCSSSWSRRPCNSDTWLLVFRLPCTIYPNRPKNFMAGKNVSFLHLRWHLTGVFSSAGFTPELILYTLCRDLPGVFSSARFTLCRDHPGVFSSAGVTPELILMYVLCRDLPRIWVGKSLLNH
ncbi:hypothetical protein KUTeg_002261 [Tegillarca granosa]|uniref:Uncharacterized protein n=1 Tax=Tegillarca granosa TaxID=220873 RepID=A0ABQ9FTT9_TEGGR|nr:hypothetical protein KUTeg_002261 [Tegillarca granosa]